MKRRRIVVLFNVQWSALRQHFLVFFIQCFWLRVSRSQKCVSMHSTRYDLVFVLLTIFAWNLNIWLKTQIFKANKWIQNQIYVFWKCSQVWKWTLRMHQIRLDNALDHQSEPSPTSRTQTLKIFNMFTANCIIFTPSTHNNNNILRSAFIQLTETLNSSLII